MSIETEEYIEIVRKYKDFVPTSIKCDGCGKVVKIENGRCPEEWYGFSGGHHGWGNDSIDSVEKFHCCSGKCYIPALAVAVEKFKNYRGSAEIDEKPYIIAKEIIES